MNNQHLQRPTLLACGLLLVLWAVPCVLGGLVWRQEQLDSALIASIERNDTSGVLTALRQGACPNSRRRARPRTVWTQIYSLFHPEPASAPREETALNVELAPFHSYKQIIDGEEWQGRNPMVIKALLDAGAEPNEADEAENRTPLVRAALYAPLEVVQMLLEHKADVNGKDGKGWTALMGAVATDDVEKTTLLLRCGADSNVKANDGNTALLIAALRHNVEITDLLLKHHADASAIDDEGNTSLKYAREGDDTNLRRLLQQAGAKE